MSLASTTLMETWWNENYGTQSYLEACDTKWNVNPFIQNKWNKEMCVCLYIYISICVGGVLIGLKSSFFNTSD
jgi:hypothetical protein